MSIDHWHLGCVGFGYKEWQGVFYPAGLSPRSQLAYYSQKFNAVEIDSTFYGIPPPEQMERWAAITAPDFIMALKTPQHITHDHRLVGVEALMHQFLDVARHLKAKLGPVLIQLPPDFSTQERNNLVAFLDGLPTDIRYAVEFRHRSWESPQTVQLLGERRICWATADYIHLTKFIRPSTDFLYLRWLGPHGRFIAKNEEQYDPTTQLRDWWDQIQRYQERTTTLYGFFNNDFAGFAPATCNRFKTLAGLPTEDIRIMQQRRLF